MKAVGMLIKKLTSFCLSVFVVHFLVGCAATPLNKPAVERYWPLPPDSPRIAFVNSFSSPNDLGKKRGFFVRAAAFLFGEGEVPHMLRPSAVATDGKETVYVTDTGLQVVHVFNFGKKQYYQLFWVERGGVRLLSPVGVALDAAGLLYVSDSQLNRVFVYNAQDPKRREPIRVLGEVKDLDRPTGVAVHPVTQEVYVADATGHRIVAFGKDGRKIREIGRRGKGDGEFNFPTHIAFDANGRLHVTDSMNFRIQILEADGTFIRKFGRLGNVLGTFSKPKGITVDAEGHIYVVDGIYDTVQIFDAEGRLLMNFGRNGHGPGDFWLPSGMVMDSENRLFVADTYNQRVQVFRFLGSPSEEELASPPEPEVAKNANESR
jgi:DNA-binding beta-propeller fold protein YncE